MIYTLECWYHMIMKITAAIFYHIVNTIKICKNGDLNQNFESHIPVSAIHYQTKYKAILYNTCETVTSCLVPYFCYTSVNFATISLCALKPSGHVMYKTCSLGNLHILDKSIPMPAYSIGQKGPIIGTTVLIKDKSFCICYIIFSLHTIDIIYISALFNKACTLHVTSPEHNQHKPLLAMIQCDL